MCYMSEKDQQPARVGVRELRQNLSVYLRRVERGEALEVTEHGRPVARLTPAPPPQLSVVERLIAEGQVTPATGFLRDLPPPLDLSDDGPTVSEILRQMRDEERG